MNFLVKDAVAGSAAVPGLFPPLILGMNELREMKRKDDFNDYDHVSLTDGGVRDNQALTALLFEEDFRCDYVIVSDASKRIAAEGAPSSVFFNVLARANEITMDAARGWLVNDTLGKRVQDKGGAWKPVEEGALDKGRTWRPTENFEEVRQAACFSLRTGCAMDLLDFPKSWRRWRNG